MSVIPQASKNYVGFDPKTIPGCALWLDAADSSTLTLSGSNVTQWNDKSGNGYSVSQSNASLQPTLTSSAQNGLSGIQLATNKYLTQTATNMSNFTTGTTNSLFVAAKNASTNTGWNIVCSIWFTDTGGGGTSRFHFSFNDDSTGTILNGTTLLAASSAVRRNTTSINTLANTILGFTVSTSSVTIHTNGITTSLSGVTLPNPTGATQFVIGDSRNMTRVSSDIMIFEMIGFNTQLTTSQRQQIEGYLANKWGLRTNLPASHPYRTIPIFSRPFQPTDITGCSLWLDAADPSTLTLSGSNVTQWNDKSGNARNATVTSQANSPTYDSTNKTVQFRAASSQSLTIAQSFGTSLVNNTFSIFVVGTRRTTGFDYFLATSATNNGEGPNAGFNGDAMNMDIYGILINGGSYYFTASIPAFAGASEPTRIYGYNINSTNYELVMNGSILATLNNSSSRVTASTNPQLGSRYAPGGSKAYHNNDVSEMVVFVPALSSSQRQQVESYLASKWGLRGNLPSTHPFKLFPAITPIFTPLQLSGCQVWLDAADASTVTLSGSNVTGWLDKSGNGKNAGTTSNYPTYSSGTIRFNGSSGTANYLDIPSFDFGTSARTAFFVMRNTSSSTGAGSQANWFWPNTGNSTNALSIVWWVVIAIQGTTFNIVYNTLNKNEYIIVGFRFGVTSGFQELFINGTRVGTSTKTDGGTSYANATSGYRLGSPNPTGTNTAEYFDGNIAEIILMNVAVGDYQRQQIEGYLATKWGLKNSLPSSHPFKVIAP